MLSVRYPTKKVLKESVGKRLNFKETSMYGMEYKHDGSFVVVGPDEYSRKWFATVYMENGLIHKVT